MDLKLLGAEGELGLASELHGKLISRSNMRLLEPAAYSRQQRGGLINTKSAEEGSPAQTMHRPSGIGVRSSGIREVIGVFVDLESSQI